MQNRPEFYELDSQGSEVGASARPFPKTPMIIAVITAVVVVVGITSIVLVNQIKNREVAQNTQQRLTQEIDKTIEDCVEVGGDQGACSASAQTGAALETMDTGFCEELSGTDFVNCIELIAVDSGDVKICKALAQGAQGRCEDRVYVRMASDGGDASACEKIGDSSLKASCEALFVVVDMSKVDELLRRGTPQDCAQLGDTEDLCVEAFRSADSDEDGLSDYDEVVVHQSDRFKADSDGDGFFDGEEVQNGFDPAN